MGAMGGSQARCGAQRVGTHKSVGALCHPTLCKSNLQAHDVLPFPWDEKQEEKREEVSKDEFNARFEAAKKRYGLK